MVSGQTKRTTILMGLSNSALFGLIYDTDYGEDFPVIVELIRNMAIEKLFPGVNLLSVTSYTSRNFESTQLPGDVRI